MYMIEVLRYCHRTCLSRPCAAVAAAATLAHSLHPKTPGMNGMQGKGFGDRRRDENRKRRDQKREAVGFPWFYLCKYTSSTTQPIL